MIYCFLAMSDFARAVYVDLAASVVEMFGCARLCLIRDPLFCFVINNLTTYAPACTIQRSRCTFAFTVEAEAKQI